MLWPASERMMVCTRSLWLTTAKNLLVEDCAVIGCRSKPCVAPFRKGMFKSEMWSARFCVVKLWSSCPLTSDQGVCQARPLNYVSKLLLLHAEDVLKQPVFSQQGAQIRRA